MTDRERLNKIATALLDEIKGLKDNIPELEEEWAASRYPGWDNGQIWIPSERYTLEDAREMEARMEASSKILKAFLEEQHGLSIRP